MGELRERMLADLQLRNYARSTIDIYLRCVKRFAAHFMRSPELMGRSEIIQFLLAVKRTSGEHNQKMHLAAIKFLYIQTLDRPEEVVRIPYPKISKPLPDVLSGSEVEALLCAVRSIKYRAILMTAYGAGMRISEVCALRSKDIDSKRNLIHIRNAKGRRARYVMLPKRLLYCLREYYQQVHPPNPYLFPGRDPARPIVPNAVRDVLKNAAKQAGISKSHPNGRIRCIEPGLNF